LSGELQIFLPLCARLQPLLFLILHFETILVLQAKHQTNSVDLRHALHLETP